MARDGLAKETTKPRRPRRTAKAAPLVPAERPQDDEVLTYLSGATAETAIGAIIDDPNQWHQTADGRFYYGEQSKTYIAIGDPRSSMSVDSGVAWKNILSLDDGTAQTFLYVMTRDLAEQSLEKTRISVNDILEFKGFRREASGDFHSRTKRKELERLLQLSEMWAAVNDEIKVKAGTRFRRKKIKMFSRLIELEFELEAPKTGLSAIGERPVPSPFLPSIIPENAVPYAFNIGLGGWAKPYRNASSYVRAVLAKIVQYDSSREGQKIAMRIALCLMFGNVDQRTEWRLSELLEKARIELPTHHADRFRDMVESALDRLEQDGLIAGWEYKNDGGGDLPVKRWLPVWLGWSVSFSARINLPHAFEGTGLQEQAILPLS